MAIYFNQNATCTVNGVDLSDHVTSATLNYKFDSVETTSMGQQSHSYIAGLQSGDVQITFNNDTATSSVMQTLNSNVGKSVIVTLTQNGSTVSATNPKYSMYCFIDAITPIAGDVGALAQQSVSWQITAAPSTATSPFSSGSGLVVTTA
jgi:hypothetical protein